ncbi:MAG: response regulator [Spirochaetia bacterium]|nr:response regulator [Spirochaetia bacterium]
MSSSIHILILDDEVIAGLGLQSVIRKMGFDRVHIAGSYEKAVEISRTHQINVAIVDINLNQQKNGIDFVDETGPFDKTIFLSGYHRSLYEKELKKCFI